MLDARFPRIPGDMGNAQSWDFPVHYGIVRGATPDLVVRQGAKGLLPMFLEAAKELVERGADGITTNCGFLSLFQDDLAREVGVPVAASSLMQVNLVNALLPPGKRSGVLTISGSTLTQDHLRAANVPLDTPIGSTEDGREFTRVILGNEQELDVAAAREDNVEAARALVDAHPEIGALVVECTNMVPYAANIREAVGIPVFSILSFVNWFHAGLVPRSFYDTGER